jgi:hypothetical protein
MDNSNAAAGYGPPFLSEEKRACRDEAGPSPRADFEPRMKHGWNTDEFFQEDSIRVPAMTGMDVI